MTVLITLSDATELKVEVPADTEFALQAFTADQNSVEPNKYPNEGVALLAIVQGAVAPLLKRFTSPAIADAAAALAAAEQNLKDAIANAAAPKVS